MGDKNRPAIVPFNCVLSSSASLFMIIQSSKEWKGLSSYRKRQFVALLPHTLSDMLRTENGHWTYADYKEMKPYRLAF